jgi:hypothetical protein
MSLLSEPDAPVMEVMRGQSQAKADGALMHSQVVAASEECKKAPDFAACFAEKSKAGESDPTMVGVRERAAPCMRGPSL